MRNIFLSIFLYIVLPFIAGFPMTAYANCEGIHGAAYFSLYKNRQATFTSVADADAVQGYKVEWFIGRKSLGSVIKKAGQSFVLKKSTLTSQSFAITGYYQSNGTWVSSRHKIFPDFQGGVQIRFDDGACDNSFETSPDLKVTISID